MAEATQAPAAAGTFCWNELLSTDVDASKKFYTGLFGWTTREMDMGPAGTYTVFVNGDKDAAGMLKNPQPGASPAWLSYIAVDDVDAVVDRAKSLGATIYVEPRNIPDIGRFSVFADPTGAMIAIYKAKT